MGQSDKGKIFPYVQFETEVIGFQGILVRIDQARTTRHGVSPLDGVIKPLVETGQGDLLATAGIELITQVEVVDVTGFQIDVTLYVRSQIEVVIDRGRDLTELLPIDRLTIGETQLVLLVEGIGGVDRGEEIVIAIELALVTLDVVSCIRDQLHLVILVAHTGIETQLPERKGGSYITSTQRIATTVTVAHRLYLQEVQLIRTEIIRVGEQLRHVHLSEPCRHLVVADIPVVDELAGAVGTRAIFAVSTHLQSRRECAKLKIVAVAHIGGDDVLIQLGELTVDLVTGGEHHRTLLQGIINGVATAVGHPAVSIGVAGAPGQFVVRTAMLTGQLSVIGRTAAVVILRTDLVI